MMGLSTKKVGQTSLGLPYNATVVESHLPCARFVCAVAIHPNGHRRRKGWLLRRKSYYSDRMINEGLQSAWLLLTHTRVFERYHRSS